MAVRTDHVGQRFGRLTVLRFDQAKNYRSFWLCQCDCGKTASVSVSTLLNGATRSCGCISRELSSRRAARMRSAKPMHGGTNTRAYTSWCAMKQRCYNPNSQHFQAYGGRGISVCSRWNGKDGFANFLSDMGQPPAGMSLDRWPDNNGDYEPSNCRWANRQDQQNNRRVNRVVMIAGVSKTVSQWSRETGVHVNTISDRLSRGLAPTDAISPEKHLDLSGLALGGRANGKRQRSKTHCIRGHAFTVENTRHYRRQRVCLTCRRLQAKALAARRKTVRRDRSAH